MIYEKGEGFEELKNPKTMIEIISSNTSDAIALDYFGEKISFRKLNSMIDSVSSQLNIEKGDIVIIPMQNIPQFVISEFAVWKKGGIVLPVNPSYSERELNFIIEDSGAKLMIRSCEAINSKKNRKYNY